MTVDTCETFCLPADIGDLDPKGAVRLCPPLQPLPALRPSLTSSPGAESIRQRAASRAVPPTEELRSGRTEPRPDSSAVHLLSDDPANVCESENLLLDASTDPHPPSESEPGLALLAYPSATWSSCPSLQRTSRWSGSGPDLPPSPPQGQLDPHRWPVLPPISPVKGEK